LAAPRNINIYICLVFKIFRNENLPISRLELHWSTHILNLSHKIQLISFKIEHIDQQHEKKNVLKL